MTGSNIYLNFDGNCREAMAFYGECLETQGNFTPYPDAPERMLHAELASGPVVLMAADVEPGKPFHAGNNFSISISCESLAEMERLFAALSKNGTVTAAMHDAFWGGRFGMLTDQFGISWMLSCR